MTFTFTQIFIKILYPLLNGVKVSKLPCLFDRASKFALFLVSGLKDEKLIKKLTYKKTETCKLYSRAF